MTNDSLNDSWYAQRHDCEDGAIEYHAYGPKDNFVVFEGPNAKGFAKVFMQAVNGDFYE